jgi:hypothetical protein
MGLETFRKNHGIVLRTLQADGKRSDATHSEE